MLRCLLAAALAALVTGCSGTPESVRPTIAGIVGLGYRCGDGIKDNVPSGLFQWHCDGAVNGTPSVVLVDGNAEGVAGVTLDVEPTNDPELARVGFARLVAAVTPLKAAPALADTLIGWTGGQQWKIVGAVRVYAGCESTRCIVMVTPVDDATRPMQLP